MKVYKLTDAGKDVVRRVDATGDEMRVLQHLADVKRATDEQLDIVAERWVVRGLKRSRLIKEVTE